MTHDPFLDDEIRRRNDPDRILRCHETEITIEKWCDSCIGWKAVCEMDLAQQTLAIKLKMEIPK